MTEPYRTVEELFAELERKREEAFFVKRWMKKKGVYGYNWWYWLKRPHKLVRRWGKGQHWKIQRGRRGYADSDLWSLDYYLMSWLPDAIDELAESQHSWPGVDYEDFSTPEEWAALLHSIAEGFRAGVEAQHDFKEMPPEWNEAFRLFQKYFWALWD